MLGAFVFVVGNSIKVKFCSKMPQLSLEAAKAISSHEFCLNFFIRLVSMSNRGYSWRCVARTCFVISMEVCLVLEHGREDLDIVLLGVFEE